MRRKNVFLTLGIVLFIVVNLLLVVNDESHRVDRVTLITDWTEASEKEMQDTMHKDGVLDYAEEHHIYRDDSMGSFDEFLVEEGDTVVAGDGLFTYDVRQLYDMIFDLENQRDQLTESVQAIEQAISRIENKGITQEEFSFTYPDDSEAGTFRQNVSDAVMVKEQYITEKQKELAEQEAELSSVEAQLEELQSGSDNVTVESPYEGKVTNIDTSLDNPLLTIEAPELYAVGELSESEHIDIESGMATDITLQENGQIFDGHIVQKDDSPIETNLRSESIYPFSVQFEEPVDDEIADDERGVENIDEEDELTIDELVQGYHADLKVIMEENPEATVVQQSEVKNEKVWLMTRNGDLVHTSVETGIEEHGDVELTSEAIEEGDWIALRPKPQFRNRSQFITPLKPSRTTWKEIFQEGPWERSMLIGLLGR